MTLTRLSYFVACIAALALPALAQTFYGSIVGTVRDPSGASIPNVAVTLTNPGTSERRSAVTDANGNYQLLNLVPGNYQIDLEAPGFNHFRRGEIQVQVASTVRIDISMQI